MTRTKRIKAVATPTITVTKKGLAKASAVLAKLPGSAHETVIASRNYRRQVDERFTQLVDDQLDALGTLARFGARRLHAISQAGSWAEMMKEQRELNAATKAAALAETRKYLERFFAAKEHVDAALKSRVLRMVSPKAKPRRAAAVPEVSVTA